MTICYNIKLILNQVSYIYKEGVVYLPHQLQVYRVKRGLSVAQLSAISGVACGTIRGIESMTSEYKTNVTVAQALCASLNVRLSDVFHDFELSHLGRPAFTGRSLSRRKDIDVLCTACNLLVPPNAMCSQCETPLPARLAATK